uniref:Flavonoid related MYB transcription factor 3 n=1 Tax=Carthamus tinctorius TaxID=4222 RepID=A0A2L1IV06_CARTI|nr:flavonoid related MYB transcription factor 3 [Carthamus tinctorius]
MTNEEFGEFAVQQPSLKRSVSAGSAVPVSSGRCFNPGSPSGSDVSDSSVPAISSSHVYRPVARSGAVVAPQIEAAPTSPSKDPPTSLSLSLPGVEPKPSTAAMQLMPPKPVVASALPPPPPPLPPPPPPIQALPLRQVPIGRQQNDLNLNNNNNNNTDLMSSIPMAISTAMLQLKVSRDPVAATVVDQQPPAEKAFTPFSAEFLSVMQEMIRKEVRNYMTSVEQHKPPQRSGDGGGGGMCMKQAATGVGEGFRNDAVVKRIGISKID